MEKKHFFMVNQFYRAKVEKMSLKFIIDNKFDYFCSVNWDKCMDGKSQTPQDERIKILQLLMPEVFDEDDDQFQNRYCLANERERDRIYDDMKMMTIDNIFLYRMTHIENIPHILRYGIVHHSSPNRNPNFVSIGDRSLIDFRSTKTVNVADHGLVLGDFIPFYFGVRMPMLYVIQRGGNYVEKARKAEEIVYVVVPLKMIAESNLLFYFSNGHATDSLTTFYDRTSIVDLPSIIDWNAVKSKYWSGDGIETDIKRRKQAEFLVKQDLSPDFIVGFVCYNEKAKNQLITYGIDGQRIKVFPNAYY